MPVQERNAKYGENTLRRAPTVGYWTSTANLPRLAVARPFHLRNAMLVFPRARNQSVSHRHTRVETHSSTGAPGITRVDSWRDTSAMSATQFSPEKLEKMPSNGPK